MHERITGTMDRITVSLTPPQMSWLKREARRLRVSIGELLRRILDAARTPPASGK
jgi:hypothetical protein